MNDNFKSGFITLIGRPNVGKSTLMNAIIGEKIAITSNKPQTTRNRIQCVYTDDSAQMVFVDTPGVTRARNKLGEYMVNVARHALEDVDLVLYLVEASDYIGKAEQHIMESLKKLKTPVILVMNKIDTVSADEVIVAIDKFSKAGEFAEIVPISARNKVNIDVLKEQIIKYLPYGPMLYDEDTLTDQSQRSIVSEIIREKSLHALSEEVPHGIAVTIDTMKKREKKNIWDIDASIVCEKASHKGIIIGKGGAMLKKIGSNARYEIERLLDSRVNLKLWVKVRKDWRDNDRMLKDFGYKE